MALMAMLAGATDLNFTELRDSLGMTDGNLSVHLRTLQEAGFVAITKSFRERRPLTTCTLTPAGRQAFAQYIDLLGQIVSENKPR